MSMKQKDHQNNYSNVDNDLLPIYEKDNLEYSRELTTSISDLNLEDSEEKDEAVELLVSELNDMKEIVEKYTKEEIDEMIPLEARTALAERFKQDFRYMPMSNPLYIETVHLLKHLGVIITREIEPEIEEKKEENEWRNFAPV
jgi:hypothetical protein